MVMSARADPFSTNSTPSLDFQALQQSAGKPEYQVLFEKALQKYGNMTNFYNAWGQTMGNQGPGSPPGSPAAPPSPGSPTPPAAQPSLAQQIMQNVQAGQQLGGLLSDAFGGQTPATGTGPGAMGVPNPGVPQSAQIPRQNFAPGMPQGLPGTQTPATGVPPMSGLPGAGAGPINRPGMAALAAGMQHPGGGMQGGYAPQAQNRFLMPDGSKRPVTARGDFTPPAPTQNMNNALASLSDWWQNSSLRGLLS